MLCEQAQVLISYLGSGSSWPFRIIFTPKTKQFHQLTKKFKVPPPPTPSAAIADQLHPSAGHPPRPVPTQKIEAFRHMQALFNQFNMKYQNKKTVNSLHILHWSVCPSLKVVKTARGLRPSPGPVHRIDMVTHMDVKLKMFQWRLHETSFYHISSTNLSKASSRSWFFEF